MSEIEAKIYKLPDSKLLAWMCKKTEKHIYKFKYIDEKHYEFDNRIYSINDEKMLNHFFFVLRYLITDDGSYYQLNKYYHAILYEPGYTNELAREYKNDPIFNQSKSIAYDIRNTNSENQAMVEMCEYIMKIEASWPKFDINKCVPCKRWERVEIERI